MVAPQDHDVRQSRWVLELHNSDLRLRPTDLSWHFLILMTIREEPLKNYLTRTFEKWKAKVDKAEVFKKLKIQKNDDGQTYTNWHKSSWSWHQPMTWTSSSWQKWSPDETSERSDLQPSGDWSYSDQTREATSRSPDELVQNLRNTCNSHLSYQRHVFPSRHTLHSCARMFESVTPDVTREQTDAPAPSHRRLISMLHAFSPRATDNIRTCCSWGSEVVSTREDGSTKIDNAREDDVFDDNDLLHVYPIILTRSKTRRLFFFFNIYDFYSDNSGLTHVEISVSPDRSPF